jgi:ornithine cyclodeaminase/alanine dehydrogenase-like protein (mu-crystallin family)
VKALGDVVTGRVTPPDLKKSTILFSSHGLAVTDVAMAARAYELARAQGIGTEIQL